MFDLKTPKGANMKNKTNDFFKRYTFKPKAITIVLTAICVIFLILSIIYANYYSIDTSANPINESYQNNELYKIACITKEIMTVATSIFGVNLLLSACVERKNKDSAFEEFFVKDIMYSPKFYDHLDNTEKEKILHNLETNVYFENSEIKKEMFTNIINKLTNENSDYIFAECKFDINCEFKDEFIEKEIIKTVFIKPINNKHQISHFPILNISSAKIDNKESVELVEVKINDKKINKHKDTATKDYENGNNIEKKLGYDNIQKLTLKKKLKFNSKYAYNKIEIKYITRVPLNDLSYICRMATPCKKFSLTFEIKNNDNYRVNAYAFGFIDDGKDSVNHDDINKVNVEFKDWIFPSDGVAISLSHFKH